MRPSARRVVTAVADKDFAVEDIAHDVASDGSSLPRPLAMAPLLAAVARPSTAGERRCSGLCCRGLRFRGRRRWGCRRLVADEIIAGVVGSDKRGPVRYQVHIRCESGEHQV
jgi:hypothetical protein